MKQSFIVLAALALTGTLSAAQALPVAQIGAPTANPIITLAPPPSPSPNIAVGKLSPARGTKQAARRRITLCEGTSKACRTTALPAKTGMVAKVLQTTHVAATKSHGSFLTFSDKWVSLCYIAQHSMATTCTPVVQTKYLLDFDVTLAQPKASGHAKTAAVVLTPHRANLPASSYNFVAQSMMKGLRRASKTLNRHADLRATAAQPTALAKMVAISNGGGGCYSDEDGNETCTEDGGGGGGGDWPESPPAPNTEIDPDIPVVVIPGKRETEPEPSPDIPAEPTPDAAPFVGDICYRLNGVLFCPGVPAPEIPVVIIPGKKPQQPARPFFEWLCEDYNYFCNWTNTEPIQSSGDYGPVYDEKAAVCDEVKASDTGYCYDAFEKKQMNAEFTRACVERAKQDWLSCLERARKAQRDSNASGGNIVAPRSGNL